MKSSIKRFTAVIGALLLGIALVILFTYIGNKSAGPFEDLMNAAGSNISELESNIIMSGRKEKRADDLKWLSGYKNNIQKLRAPDTIFMGAFDNNTSQTFRPVIDLEDTLGLQLSIISIYTAWGDKPDQRFPANKVRTIIDLGSIPMITWEPWLTDFDQDQHPHLPDKEERDKGGLQSIVDGDYDFYLNKWIADFKRIDSPIFLRLGHEMNDAYRYPWGPQNNTNEEFVSMWRYVHDYFNEHNVDNVLWVWSPHPAYRMFYDYYPGEDYVDWIGIGTLNYGTVATWSEWWTFDEIFGSYYGELSYFKKPIMLTEFASLPVGGDRPAWYWGALNDLPNIYPLVKSVIFFHFSDDNTTTYKSLNWYIIDDAETVESIISAMDCWTE